MTETPEYDIPALTRAAIADAIDWIPVRVVAHLGDKLKLPTVEAHQAAIQQVRDILATVQITAKYPAPAPTFDVIVWYMEGNHWFGDDGWTWCKVANDVAADYTPDLPRCVDEADARAQAQAWLDSVRKPAAAESAV